MKCHPRSRLTIISNPYFSRSPSLYYCISLSPLCSKYEPYIGRLSPRHKELTNQSSQEMSTPSKTPGVVWWSSDSQPPDSLQWHGAKQARLQQSRTGLSLHTIHISFLITVRKLDAASLSSWNRHGVLSTVVDSPHNLHLLQLWVSSSIFEFTGK